MMIWWFGSLVFAAPSGPWGTTFVSEADRAVSAQMQRTVLVEAGEAEEAGLALCRVLDSPTQRCALVVLSKRERRDTDAQIASTAEGLVYVVRSVPESTGVTVSVFHGSASRLDWYTAQPRQRPVSRSEIGALRRRVERLEGILAGRGNVSVRPKELAPIGEPASSEVERAAMALLVESVEAANALKPERAWLALHTLSSQFGATDANRQADRIRRELGVLGRSSIPLDADLWFVAPTSDFDATAPTLLVFFEVWCPHSRAAIPQLNELLQQKESTGWQVVGYTQQTRGVDHDQVVSFVHTHGLSFAVGRDSSGRQAKQYAVLGVPAAVALVDGKVLWRGHPSHITTDLLSQLVAAP